MQPHRSIEQIIEERHSIRNYEQRALSPDDRGKIVGRLSSLTNPFQVNVSFRLLETAKAEHGRKLGTYGVIKGATSFIAATVPDGALALEGLGYSFEALVLYLTSIGLGTCWLGGTFNRSEFAREMGVKEGDLFPVISPVGYPSDKRRVGDLLARRLAKSDQRKEWNALFFNQDFSHPLSDASAGAFAFPLEMLRLAPSAANRQPWRIVREDTAFHFYEMQSYGEKNGIDIQRVDLGIASCHFHLAAQERNLPGRIQVLPAPAIKTPPQTHYVFSWLLSKTKEMNEA